ncbi:MAG: HAMP domain-containing histidine kinase [Bacteriovoracaceae bacterium]|jgi:signal transduction histidine kinase|nr:HAMP domain-containing histidine kinase [Bacteriovoracaceae bacterium]
MKIEMRGFCMSREVAQFLHDISSPLAVLDSIIGTEQMDSVQGKDIAGLALKRLVDITTSFRCMEKGKKFNRFCVGRALQEIISEKIVEHDFQNITLSKTGPVTRLQVSEFGFKRVLSNIINNAIEAISDNEKKVVHIALKCDKDSVIVKVSDNGKGIPCEILEKLNQSSFSWGKTRGQGLGLSHARTYMYKSGGNMSITSIEGVGTEIRLIFPLP